MSSSVKVSHIVSSRYALALIDLAGDREASEAVEHDLRNIIAVLNESPELTTFIESPSTTRAQVEKMVELLGAQIKAHKLTVNFLKVLVANRRLPGLKAITQATLAEFGKRRGEVNIEVKTAQDLGKEQIAALQESFSKNLGRKVAIRALVEPSILGGMIVTVGSQMIDDSVARKIQRLKTAMSGKANQNTDDTTKAREA
ncbi:MAG: ATP synthase F1 subunit delta [Alphaproteobacteria bacterium]